MHDYSIYQMCTSELPSLPFSIVFDMKWLIAFLFPHM